MKVFRLLFIVFTFSPLSVFADQAAQIEQMLGFFGTNCSANGEQTQNVHKSVSNLISTLKSIKNDPNCQSLSGSIKDLELVAAHAETIAKRHNESDREILALESKKRELFYLLSVATLDAEKELLKTEIRTTQYELAKQKGFGEADRKNESQSRLVESMKVYSSTTNAFFNRLVANQSCWVKHPNLIQGAAAFGSSVGQSLGMNLASGGAALGISSGINFIASFIDYLHKSQQEKRIKAMSDVLQPTALACTMETMANQWCQAQDVVNAVELVARAILSKRPQDKVWSGIKILERELPNLTAWLSIVRAGDRPSSSAVAGERIALSGKQSNLDTTRDFANGIISEKNELFVDADGNLQTQWEIVRSVVIAIVDFAFSNSSNPLRDSGSQNQAYYRLIGHAIPRTGSGLEIQFKNLNPFEDLQNFVPSMSDVQDNFAIWFSNAQVRFENEKNKKIFTDPALIFAQGYERQYIGTQKGLSARHSLMKIISFLKGEKVHSKRYSDSRKTMTALHEETIERLEAILKIIEDVSSGAKEAELGLREVSEKANLKNSAIFIERRITFFVRLIIEDLVLNRTGISDDLSLQLLAAQDIVRTLQQFSGRKMQVLHRDAKTAQSTVQRSLVPFFDTFAENINESLDALNRTMAAESELAASDAIPYSKTFLCLNLMTTAKSNSKVNLNTCFGLQEESVFPGGPSTPVFSAELVAQPLKKRFCLNRDFIRKNNVLQSLAESGFMGGTELPDVQALFQSQARPAELSGEIAKNETTVSVSGSCKNASAWKTDTMKYCEQDWWDGCDRQYAKSCEAVKKKDKTGLVKFFDSLNLSVNPESNVFDADTAGE